MHNISTTDEVAKIHFFYAQNLKKIEDVDSVENGVETIMDRNWDVSKEVKMKEKRGKVSNNKTSGTINLLPKQIKDNYTIEQSFVKNNMLESAYNTYRKSLYKRDGKDSEKIVFHGTTKETVDKIMTQGFNRSFCGKNATVYGNGVYFASNMDYSLQTQYSKPDQDNYQYIITKIVVGQYCLGESEKFLSIIKNEMFDTTVNNMQNPTIYVTYNDSQALPYIL